MKTAAYLLIMVLFVSTTTSTQASAQDTSAFYSFENGFEGWAVNGIDLPGAGDWSLTLSQETAKDGNTSAKFDLNNRSDAGKIWIEREFACAPNQIYEATIQYVFASATGSQDFTIITGCLDKHPTTFQDLIPAYQEDISAFISTPADILKWFKKKYQFAVRTDAQGAVHTVIGIWGTFESRGIFYVDNVRITLSKKPEGTQFYSFENDFEGWTTNGTDLNLGDQTIVWSITRSQEHANDGASSIKFDLDNLNGNGKIWIAKSFFVERQNRYQVSVEYEWDPQLSTAPRFRIMTGVFRNRPETGDDLIPAYQEEIDRDRHWEWLHKQYQFSVKSKKSEMLYVVIGVLGTDQAHRKYYLDNVCVTLTKQ